MRLSVLHLLPDCRSVGDCCLLLASRGLAEVSSTHLCTSSTPWTEGWSVKWQCSILQHLLLLLVGCLFL